MEMARKITTFVAMAKFRLRNREEERQQLKIKVIVLVEEETEKTKTLASGSPCKHSKTKVAFFNRTFYKKVIACFHISVP